MLLVAFQGLKATKVVSKDIQHAPKSVTALKVQAA